MKNMAHDKIFCPLCLKYPLNNVHRGLLCKLCGYSMKSREEYLELSQTLKKEIKDHLLICKHKPEIILVNENNVHGICFICKFCYRVFSKDLNK